jgi:hypothetical protein
MGTCVLSSGVKRGRGVTLTTNHHLVPRSTMSSSYTSSLLSAFMAVEGQLQSEDHIKEMKKSDKLDNNISWAWILIFSNIRCLWLFLSYINLQRRLVGCKMLNLLAITHIGMRKNYDFNKMFPVVNNSVTKLKFDVSEITSSIMDWNIMNT